MLGCLFVSRARFQALLHSAGQADHAAVMEQRFCSGGPYIQGAVSVRSFFGILFFFIFQGLFDSVSVGSANGLEVCDVCQVGLRRGECWVVGKARMASAGSIPLLTKWWLALP